MNYIDTFICVAEDCPVGTSVVPRAATGKKKSAAVIQYELLAEHPYIYTQEDVLFETHVRGRELSPEEIKERGAAMRDDFFAKPQPCLRTSPLAKKYGWGFHFDHDGKVALCPMESSDYAALAQGETDRGLRVLTALRSRRG